MPEEQPRLTSVKTDTDLAKEFKERMSELLGQICALMDEATARGLSINFQIGKDQFNRTCVQAVTIARPL